MIDTYYRIKTLHDLGVKVHLHCFEYGRIHSIELESLCETVNYYPRRKRLFHFPSLVPFIVSGRKSNILLKNLSSDDYPILFDGLHTTYYLAHNSLRQRMKFVRMHNIEHLYYKSLYKSESNIFRKIFYLVESTRLKWYEELLSGCVRILAISETDNIYFDRKYHNSVLLSPFHPFNSIECIPGFGHYVLYHGDLSIVENAMVADSIISEICPRISYPCIIAGKSPSKELLLKASKNPNIKVVSNPDNAEMMKLIKNAHIQLLPAISSNGFKIKLIFALFSGRHCLINSIISNDNRIISLCRLADSNEEFIDQINILIRKKFDEEMIRERQIFLSEVFSNEMNAKKLIKMIFDY